MTADISFSIPTNVPYAAYQEDLPCDGAAHCGFLKSRDQLRNTPFCICLSSFSRFTSFFLHSSCPGIAPFDKALVG